MSKKGGFGKFLGGLAIGAGLGILFAPDKGENTRKVLAKKVDELLKKLNEIDLDEVKDELLFRVESLQAELSETGDKISSARQFYSDTVLKYNNKIHIVNFIISNI